jgi:hypothetical protein
MSTTTTGADTTTSAPPRPPPLHRAYRHPRVAIALFGIGGSLLVGAGAGLGPAEGVAALAAAVFGMLVVRRPAIGALTLVALTPVLSGFKRGMPVPGLKLSEILIVYVGGLILVSADRRHQDRWGPFDLLALVYAAATLTLAAADVLDRHLLIGNDTARAALSPIQYFVLYRAVLIGLPSREGRRRALQLILLASVPESLLAIMQQFHIAGVRGFVPHLTGVNIDTTFGAEGGGTRASGAFPHWQVLAGYEFAVLVIGTSVLVEREQRVLPRWALGGVLLLASAALFTSVTLTPMIGVLVAALALAAWSRRITAVAGGLLAVAVVAATLFGPTLSHRVRDQFSDPGNARPAWVPQTVYYRYQVWTGQYFPALSGKWLTGYGPDLPPSVRFPFTESLYITLLLRGGLPLLGAYLLLTAALLGAAIRARNDPEPERRVSARALAIMTVLLLPMHLIEPYFILTGGSHLIWISAGLALRSAPLAGRREPTRAPWRVAARRELAPRRGLGVA